MPEELHLLITGRVQGVGFRWFVRVAARRLGLSGWVMNRADGAVEIAAGGSGSRLAEFKKIVSVGPEGAAVEEVREVPATGGDLGYPFAQRR